MIVLLPFLALIIGVVAGLHIVKPITGDAGVYLAIACLAGIDSVCGGIRAGMESKFQKDVFITGFVSNTLIAFLFAWLGDKIGINVNLASAVVFGTRIFLNLSLIRRYLLIKIQDSMKRREELRQKNQTLATAATPETNS